ncbi:cytochrome c oxidase subunit II [Methylonatrum kenyense]|uniref:cytochrome c oxidase subunit II n=1 Tax=Methylonatrum kenyense TaxID=455253 RepID=UPI0020BDC349|nr:cytochrome c oxidase subunit II [Methylonatrum kenyense]MCK8515157.1 cytochrome c oxidase subunit II [Methylonatrum kenyense]
MILAIVLALIVIGSVAFHFVTPWTVSALASNWSSMDAMLQVSFAITGVVFVAVSLFMVVALIRFRHRPGHRARFEPDNRRLEWWLLGATTAGIVGLLAPGLIVYADFVRAPPDAMQVEVVGDQWRYGYRFPGADGQFGAANVRHVRGDNPLGLDPDDPAGQDDIVIRGGDLRLPVDQPVEVLLRSNDVIHGFFVPQFRAKMDMVPGMVTRFWFTPTRTGRFEVLCTQHCGVGHFNMRGAVVVKGQEDFDAWLADQRTFGEQLAMLEDPEIDAQVIRGRNLAEQHGCVACHSVDGSRQIGPTWLNLYDSEVTLADGSTVVADADYIRRSITDPGAELTQGFPPVMPAFDLDDADLGALVSYIRSLAEAPEDRSEPEEMPHEAQAPGDGEEPARGNTD